MTVDGAAAGSSPGRGIMSGTDPPEQFARHLCDHPGCREEIPFAQRFCDECRVPSEPPSLDVDTTLATPQRLPDDEISHADLRRVERKLDALLEYLGLDVEDGEDPE